jgi:hypothetical protein
MREQVRDQAKALVGRVRRRRQAEVHQRELRRLGQLAQQFHRVRARFADQHLEVGTQRERQRIGDQRVVVDDQQPRAAFRRGVQ